MLYRAPYNDDRTIFYASLFKTNFVQQTDHRFPYVAGHRYEFQVEPAQGVELAVRGGGGGDRQATPSSPGAKAETPASGLHVVFSLISSYTKRARLCHKDAARSSLPTFEAPPAYNSQQPKEPRPSSTVSTAPSSAAENISPASRASEQKPTSEDVRQSPSPSVAAALVAPCASPPPPGMDNLAALRASTEASAPRPGGPAPPAPAAAAKAPAGTPSNRTVVRFGGGAAEGFAWGGAAQNAASGDLARAVERNGQLWPGSGIESERRDHRERTTVGGGQDLRERSPLVHARAGAPSPRSFMPSSPYLYPYNAQQYRERLPEGATGMVGGDQPTAGGLKWNPAWEQQRLPTLPYIRRHVDHASPRSAFERQSPSGGPASFATRDSVAGVDRFARPPGYFAHDPPTQRKRQAETGRAEDGLHTGYHPPARERTLYGPPPRVYHPGYASDVHSSVATRREHHMPPDARITGPHRGERRDDSEKSRASNNRSRWREDDDEGWARKSDRNAYLTTGHDYQPANARGHNRDREEGPGHYQEEPGRGGIYNASSLSDSSRRGYKYGNGVAPSGKETAGMVGTGGGGGGAALSDPSRGRAFARGGAVMGRGRRDEQRGVELTGRGDYHVGNGGYSERLLPDGQARREVDSTASRESVSLHRHRLSRR